MLPVTLPATWTPSVGKAATIPCHQPAIRLYNSVLRRTVIVRQPKYESPEFLRTVLGLCLFKVVLLKSAGSTLHVSAQNRTALSTFALSWMETRYWRSPLDTPRESSQRRKKRIIASSELINWTRWCGRHGLAFDPSAQ